MLRVALVGAGAHSLTCHAPALRHYVQQNPHKAALAVLCDLDMAKAHRAAAEFGFARACATIDDVLADKDINVVVSVLPIPAILHATRALVKREIPLLIEKPLGRDLSETRAIHEAIKTAGAMNRVMVSFNRRYDPAIALGLEWAARQGPVRYVRGSMIRINRTEPDFVWGTGIHLIDALWHVIGPLELRHVQTPGESADCWRIALLEGRNRATVIMEILTDAGDPEERIRLAGDGYQVDIYTGVVPPWRVRATRHMKIELDACAPDGEPSWISNGTYAETAAFLDAAAAGAPLPPPGIREALLSTELAARLQQNIEQDNRSKPCP